jgi:hypothetical protein
MIKVIKAVGLRSIAFVLACGIAQTSTTSKKLSPAIHPAQTKQSEPLERTRLAERHQTQYSANDESLNRLQDFFTSSLKATEKRFEGQSGMVRGFGAGTGYPQIWLRDSATVIPVSRFYYSSEYLTTWLEEHLSHQSADGSLYDWIAAGARSNFLEGAPRAKEVYRAKSKVPGEAGVISADKNTTEADQETSAVDAAYQVFQITGDRKWLRKQIRGETLVNRLDRSLGYLLTARFDPAHGLLKNAFTADWGDVSPTYSDQRAIYLDDKTPKVAGLYTNVLFYRAARQMDEIYRALGRTNRAAYWQRKAAMIKANINKHLWREDKGFYRVHINLSPSLTRGWHDDSDIFAMGGNGLAALYGVAGDAQSARVFEVAERRQHEFGFSTIAGVLLPAYPKGFFKHPAVNQEYYYQNGGQWDWFAARFLLAEFERGFSTRARRQLSQLAAKTVENGGLYEWHTRDGKGMGSSNYVGNAGSLGSAIFQGLHGVYLTNQTLHLKIRLGDQSSQLSLFEPATGKYVRYAYRYLGGSNNLNLTYESNVSGAGRICVLVPANREPEELILDGEKKTYRREVVGEDIYACFATDWKAHESKLKWGMSVLPVKPAKMPPTKLNHS